MALPVPVIASLGSPLTVGQRENLQSVRASASDETLGDVIESLIEILPIVLSPVTDSTTSPLTVGQRENLQSAQASASDETLGDVIENVVGVLDIIISPVL